MANGEGLNGETVTIHYSPFATHHSLLNSPWRTTPAPAALERRDGTSAAIRRRRVMLGLAAPGARASARRHRDDRRGSRARSAPRCSDCRCSSPRCARIGAWMSSTRGIIEKICCSRSTSRRAIGSSPSSTSALQRRRRGTASARPTSPSGCSSVPARIVLVSESGAESNCRAVAIDRSHGVPERLGRILELRRDLAQQPGFVQLPEGLRGVPGPEDLVVLLEQPWRRAARDLVLVRAIASSDVLVDRELQPRRQDDRAQHADGILEEADFGIADAADQRARRGPAARRCSR